MTDENTCVNCAKFFGNCGHHLIDKNRHILYEVPEEYMYDRGYLTCFEPSEKYKQTIHDRAVKDICDSYSPEMLQEAIDYLNSQKK